MMRWFRFLLAIVVGGILGLAWGWVISPVRYVNTSPDSLRIDYRTDYVLMVSEAYSADGDLGLVVRRLARLGNSPPAEIVLQAIEFAREQGYTEADQQRMMILLNALGAGVQPEPVGSP